MVRDAAQKPPAKKPKHEETALVPVAEAKAKAEAKDHKGEISKMLGFLKYRASANNRSGEMRSEAAAALEVPFKQL